MRLALLAYTAFMIAHTAPSSAQNVRDCTPPPVKDGVDFGLPCYLHPPEIPGEKKVYFSVNSSSLSDDSRLVLDHKAEVLLRLRGIRIVVFGHCDPDEGDALAVRRAEVVREYLVARGIPKASVSVDNRGSRWMVMLNPSEEARAAMRFVSIEPPPEQ